MGSLLKLLIAVGIGCIFIIPTKEEKKNPKPMQGIKGWLLFFVIYSVYSIVSSSVVIFTIISDLSKATMFDWSQVIGGTIFICINICILILAAKRNHQFVFLEILYNYLSIVYMIVIGLFMYGVVQENMQKIKGVDPKFAAIVGGVSFVAAVVIEIVLKVAQILYFKKSVRVKKTFLEKS